MAKRSKALRGRVKRAALVGGAAVATSALTVGLGVPGAGTLAVANERADQVRALDVELTGLLEDLGLPFTDVEVANALRQINLLKALGVDVPGIGDLFELPAIEIGDVSIELPLGIITTGPLFGALGILGLNPFWVPALPGAIAEEINSVEYVSVNTGIDVSINSRDLLLITLLLSEYFLVASEVRDAVCQATECPVGNFAPGLPNFRVPIVLGIGPGALGAGMALGDVLADLPNQPGGTADGAPEGRSLTILTMLLLRNPGRADGGIVARFAPLTGLFGLDVVTPDLGVIRDGDATLVPIKIDATVEYDPLSDFAAWPNPFTLANNGAALLFPTYLLRGSEQGLTEMLSALVAPLLPALLGNVAYGLLDSVPESIAIEAVGPLVGPDVCLFGTCWPMFNIASLGPFSFDVRGNAIALLNAVLPVEIPEGYFDTNVYLTFRQNSLPLLEPLRLPFDLLNVITGGQYGFVNPFADALEPALKLLTNLGYTNVTQDMTNPLNPYPRVFDTAYGSQYAPFFTFPENIDWAKVPGDLFTALAAGIENAFFSGGNPFMKGPGVVNPLGLLGDLLGGLLNLTEGIPGLGDFLGGLGNFGGLGQQTVVNQTNVEGVQRTAGSGNGNPDVVPNLDRSLVTLDNDNAAGDGRQGRIAVQETQHPQAVDPKNLPAPQSPETVQSPETAQPPASQPPVPKGGENPVLEENDPGVVVEEEPGTEPAPKPGTAGPRFGNGRTGTGLREVGQKIGDSLRDAVAATAGGVRDLGTKPHKAPQRAAKAEPGDADKAA